MTKDEARAEIKRINALAMRAAADALGEISDDHGSTHIAKRVVLAIAAAARILDPAIQENAFYEFDDLEEDFGDPEGAAASALWWLMNDCEFAVEEVEPGCIGGAAYIGFARGYLAARLSVIASANLRQNYDASKALGGLVNQITTADGDDA